MFASFSLATTLAKIARISRDEPPRRLHAPIDFFCFHSAIPPTRPSILFARLSSFHGRTNRSLIFVETERISNVFIGKRPILPRSFSPAASRVSFAFLLFVRFSGFFDQASTSAHDEPCEKCWDHCFRGRLYCGRIP